MSRGSQVLDQLRSIRVFAPCSDAELNEISRLATPVDVKAGQQIAKQGDLGHEFIVIVSGEAVVEKDGREVGRLGPGDYLGEIALIDAVTRTASVVAATDMSLEVIDKRGFNTLLDSAPTLARTMLRGLVHRIVDLESEVAELRSRPAGGD